MSDASLWALFVADALAVVGLVVLAVRGVRRSRRAPVELSYWPEPAPVAQVPVPAQRSAPDVVVDLREEEPVHAPPQPVWVTHPPRATLD